MMTATEYWKNIGLLDDFNEKEAKYAIDFYEEIGFLMRTPDSDLKRVLKNTGIAKLWDSYLPQTNAEWFKISLTEIGSDAVVLKEICKFDEEIWDDLIYDVVYKMLKHYKNLDITELIEVLENITVESLLNEKPVESLTDYITLYDFVLKVILAQCSAFYEVFHEIDSFYL